MIGIAPSSPSNYHFPIRSADHALRTDQSTGQTVPSCSEKSGERTAFGAEYATGQCGQVSPSDETRVQPLKFLVLTAELHCAGCHRRIEHQRNNFQSNERP